MPVLAVARKKRKVQPKAKPRKKNPVAVALAKLRWKGYTKKAVTAHQKMAVAALWARFHTQRPRLDDIAARAGVSYTTAARVMSNSKIGVSESARERVLAAVEALMAERRNGVVPETDLLYPVSPLPTEEPQS